MKQVSYCKSDLSKVIRHNHGGSLVEILVGMMITVVAIGSIVTLLSTSLAAWKAGNSRTDVQQTARFALDSIVRDVQFATTVTIVNSNQLRLQTTKYSDSTSTSLTAIEYIRDSGILYRKAGSAYRQPMTGGSSNSAVSITEFALSVLKTDTQNQPLTIGILLTVEDAATLQRLTVETAVTRRLGAT